MSKTAYTTERAYGELHFSVLLWGFTGILGRLITIDSFLLVWYRLLFTCLSLLLFRGVLKEIKKSTPTLRWQLIIIGSIAALHWITFYGAIHLANVSVAVGALALTSIFTSILEPLFTRKKINIEEVIIGIFVGVGLGIMFIYGQHVKLGMLVGVASAFLAAVFTTLNKLIVDKYDPEPKAMTFIELGGGWLFCCFAIPLTSFFISRDSYLPSQEDLLWLILLAVICTTLPFVLSLRALKKLSAFSSVLAINMEPIYSIILAIIIFNENEELNLRFYLGTLIVILSVFSYPILQKRLKNTNN